jgi:hypothetical protein
MLKSRPALALALLVLLAPASVSAQQGQGVDLGSFIKETMALRMEGDRAELAMWFPHEFFLAASMERGLPPATAERELEFLRPYLTIAIQTSYDKPDGTSVYATENDVRRRAVLRLDDGTELPPVQNPPPLVAATLAGIKGMLAAQNDNSSANMHFLVFPATTKQGKPVVQTSRKDKLRLVLKRDTNYNETALVWRTPFDAVTKAPSCPKCQEAMSSKWTYCPYDGQKLP